MSLTTDWGFYWLDVLAIVWLGASWIGYSVFAKHKARCTFCIASVLHNYRKRWMLAMLRRDNRISDASFLTNLERNASFLASTAILIIAGLVTSLASIDKIYVMVAEVPFSQTNLTPMQLQVKIVVLLCIFAYAFFTFTWAMRQYGFCAVLLGAAPLDDDAESRGDKGRRYAHNTAKVIDQAGHSYNYGLRSYYFSLAVLVWVLNTWLFVTAVATVVLVLYYREFHSKTLKAMINITALRLEDIERPQKNRQENRKSSAS